MNFLLYISTGSFYLAKSSAELPFVLVVSFLFSAIFYKMSHQIDDTYRFWSFLCVWLFLGLISQGYGLLCSILSNSNINMACSQSVLIFCLHCLSMQYTSYGWIKLFEPMRYLSYGETAYELMLYLIYGFDRCPSGQIPKLLWKYKIDELDKFYLNLGILIFHLIIIRVMGLFVLICKAYNLK